MNADDLNLDQRLLRFEAQLDRFSLALHQWQQQTRVTSQSAVPGDVDQRIRTIEETIDREAVALRRMHEEPLKQLAAHAANLKEICAAAATSVNGLDQAESRLAAMQADVHLHLSELSRTLQALVAELRGGTSSALSTQSPAAAWPLERIVHLHDELRRTANDRTSDTSDGDALASPPTGFQPRTVSDSSSAADRQTRLQLLPSAVSGEQEPVPDSPEPRVPVISGRRALYAGAALLTVVAVLAFSVERRIEKQLNDAGDRMAAAERRAAAATQQANQEVVVAREQANRQIVEARDAALRAETVGAILTAPDLIRFTLTSGASLERSSAQVLWSRTRGVVLSASRLPAAPPNTIYQLWLKTSAESVSAGVFVPDATGRATLVTAVPPKVPGPVVGAEVTVEPNGGVAVPSGRTLLVRYPPS